MQYRLLVFISALAFLLVASLPGQDSRTPVKSAPRAKAGGWTVPRAPDGHPDLQGVWTNVTLTPMERPGAFAGKGTVTEAEARAYVKKDLETNDIDREDSPLLAAINGANAVGGYNNLFIDRGSQLALVDGVRRTSLIVDPPDGKVPPLTAEAQKRRASMMRSFNRYDSVKDRPLSERCIIGFGSTSGPPMMPVLYNNTYQFVQTKDNLMILVEMVHDVRVIRMNGTHAPSSIRSLLGDSIGKWEGETLVVDTTNFREEGAFFGGSENQHVIERFQRISPDTILYRVTIDDPSTYSKQWTMEFPFHATPGPIYEYACHEGNYAMTDILDGARKSDGATGQK